MTISVSTIIFFWKKNYQNVGLSTGYYQTHSFKLFSLLSPVVNDEGLSMDFPLDAEE
jgi:hypothetical protein